MDIKDLLKKEISASQEAKEAREREDKLRQEEAKHLFEPVAAAARELQTELAGNLQIKIHVSDHFAEFRLGNDIKLEVTRYGWSNKFKGREEISGKDPFYGTPEFNEHEREFTTHEEAIQYFVKACAEFIAHNSK